MRACAHAGVEEEVNIYIYFSLYKEIGRNAHLFGVNPSKCLFIPSKNLFLPKKYAFFSRKCIFLPKKKHA